MSLLIDKHEILIRALQREKAAKQQAEKVIEEKSKEIYTANQELGRLNSSLEKKVKERTEQLAIATQRAEESALAKERFLANISHEIRTPMNAIIGFTALLNKEIVASKPKAYVEAIKTSSNNLLALINDILDFSKVTAGKVELDFVEFNFRELIKTSVYSFQEMASRNRITLDHAIDERIERILVSDTLRINQILNNLLSNAIKFSKNGKVTLTCDLISVKKRIQNIKITVKDTGVGIDKKNLKNIFESFSQEDQSVTRKYGGTGLGLAICKELIQLLGGGITVKSKKGVGTKFEVILPFRLVNKEEIMEDAKHVEGLKNLDFENTIRVLSVEDNDFNQLLVEAIFEGKNAILEIAENGKVAIKKIKENKYDIILMDVQMPIMDGIEATTYIRKELKLNIPIIALTANAMKHDEEKYIACGMSDYISKPFDEEVLINKIKKLISQDLHIDEKVIYDLSEIRKITGKDENLFGIIISKFLRNNTQLIQKSLLNLKNEDIEQFKFNMHKMKASFKLVHAEALLKINEEVEALGDTIDEAQKNNLLKRIRFHGFGLLSRVETETSKEFEPLVRA